MKVTIFNGSTTKNDVISILTSSAMSMFKAAGAETNEFIIHQMNIKSCMDCGIKRPDDDLKKLTDEFDSSDLVIFASSVHTFGLSGYLNLLIENLHPICRFDEAFAERIKGKKMAVMIAFKDADNISHDVTDPLKMFCEYFNMKYMGEFASYPADKDQLIGKYQNEISDFVEKVMK